MLELSEKDEREMRRIISFLAESEREEERLKNEEKHLGSLLYSAKSNKIILLRKVIISIALLAWSGYSYYWAHDITVKGISIVVAFIGFIYGCYGLKNRKKYDCSIEICENGIRGAGYRGSGNEEWVRDTVGKSRIKNVKLKNDELYIDADNPYWHDMCFYGICRKRKIRRLIKSILGKQVRRK